MTSIVLIGVGGYGGLIAREVLENANAHGAFVAGIVEPFIENSPVKDMLGDIPVYKDIEEFYTHSSAELAIISTPIHLHAQQCIYCMAHGSDVLCEKPIAPTVEDALKMKQASEKYNKHLNIGFQLSHAPAILRLKEDIPSFGKPISCHSLTCWPRNSSYFARPWAAKRTIGGAAVNDSIAMNACAHYLHIMLFLLGGDTACSAMPQKLRGALARANDIEMFDTAALELIWNGIPIRFLASHATESNFDPHTRLRFENAEVTITEADGDDGVTVTFANGKKKVYGATYGDRFQKIWYALDVARGEKQPVCTVDTALPHLKCVCTAGENIPIHDFSDTVTANDVKCVRGLDKAFIAAHDNDSMPWDILAPSEWLEL